MPISQSRLIDLITAADAVITTYRNLCSVAERQRALLDTSDAAQLAREAASQLPRDHIALRAIEELRSMYLGLIDTIVIDHAFPVEALLTLATERAHFRATAKRNNASKHAMRVARERRKGGFASLRDEYNAFNRGEISEEESGAIRDKASDDPRAEYERQRAERRANEPASVRIVAKARDGDETPK